MEGATLTSGLNEPYVLRVDIHTDMPGVEPLDLLGSAATFTIRRGLSENVYGGIVSSVRSEHDHDGDPAARVVVEPALSALRHGRDSRIFQEKSVATILEEVLTEALAPYGREVLVDLQRAYPDREYTVQYQESDFDFVHRLMEEEGIVYHFEDADGVEKLVLLDDPTQHPQIDGALLEYSSVMTGGGLVEREYVRAFEPISTTVGTVVRTRHFDWTHPSVLIEGEQAGAREGEAPDGGSFGPERESYQHDEPLTLHDYSREYRAHDVTDQQRIRRDQQRRDAIRHRGDGTVTGLRAGLKFELHGHPQLPLNAEYVVTHATHLVGTHAGRGASSGDEHYQNRFVTVPADVPYRPRRTRPRPRVHGIQTAIVTGPAGEEIHTDEHGRVKVQFPWDRLGEMDEKTTCWIRCMQTWSGAGFGAWVLPRVGMEVIVSFVDGDLDRPIVTGCVYNGDNLNPYEMPAKKMVSTFKTNSYPGGDGYNELRFDDTKNEEEIWIHGEKDWNTVIENDLYRDVRHDETQNVVRMRKRTVGVNETVNVGSNRTKSVGANETLNVGANRTRTVGHDETVYVNHDRKHIVLNDEKIEVGRHRTTHVGKTETLRADESVLIKSGDSSILLEADGTITITGKKFLFHADEEFKMEGQPIRLN